MLYIEAQIPPKVFEVTAPPWDLPAEPGPKQEGRAKLHLLSRNSAVKTGGGFSDRNQYRPYLVNMGLRLPARGSGDGHIYNRTIDGEREQAEDFISGMEEQLASSGFANMTAEALIATADSGMVDKKTSDNYRAMALGSMIESSLPDFISVLNPQVQKDLSRFSVRNRTGNPFLDYLKESIKNSPAAAVGTVETISGTIGKLSGDTENPQKIYGILKQKYPGQLEKINMDNLSLLSCALLAGACLSDRKNWRHLSKAAVVTLMLLLLSACSPASDAGPDTPSGVPADEPKEQETEIYTNPPAGVDCSGLKDNPYILTKCTTKSSMDEAARANDIRDLAANPNFMNDNGRTYVISVLDKAGGLSSSRDLGWFIRNDPNEESSTIIRYGSGLVAVILPQWTTYDEAESMDISFQKILRAVRVFERMDAGGGFKPDSGEEQEAEDREAEYWGYYVGGAAAESGYSSQSNDKLVEHWGFNAPAIVYKHLQPKGYDADSKLWRLSHDYLWYFNVQERPEVDERWAGTRLSDEELNLLAEIISQGLIRQDVVEKFKEIF
ncbi:MAG: hypothetical protein UV73_C0014G0040 [Candidatus Gottesmanbacteria bacterium GW2011_GWA2_43_14]|uniref:Uncharacterized protein n=1 Tax=Candidatus Gottesmanbacteria bacterium GW2011_GWA2_43_14 TaxID=1618443 RepID=A0A0G1G9X2_9BACT|nr:MAG: hypothetical protein UV73_C0014G0040 [Candidatus Gottesmanbacteria bacterium GW2011_GWA2_43_14]